MLDQIKNVLLQMNTIDGWLIEEKRTQSEELFLIVDKIDMNRAKDVTKYAVTVFVDHGEDHCFRGSSKVTLLPGMDQEEIKIKLDESAYAASFVKNKAYPLVSPEASVQTASVSSFSKKDLAQWLPELIDALYKEDKLSMTTINSSEVFIIHHTIRIMNSKGVDVSYDNYNVEVEVIIDSTAGPDAVEMFDVLSFSEFNPHEIASEVSRLLIACEDRARALPTPSITVPVVLTQESVKRFLSFYIEKSDAQMVYEGVSQWKIGMPVQGDQVRGDLITATLLRHLDNSPEQAPYDQHGKALKDTVVIEDGILKTMHGTTQYSYYLGVEPTGRMRNLSIAPGRNSEADWLSKPHIKCVSFSDFQLNPVTGDFGGELRLAYYFDGNTTKAVTGGSISGNVGKIHDEIYLSSELKQNSSFIGPKSVMIPKLTIAGT